MNNVIQKCLKMLIPIVFLMLGISIFCYPMFLNFDNLPGDYLDARYINYVLEHGFLWFNQAELHQNFWDMPIFYPNKNTLAFGDVIIIHGKCEYCKYFAKIEKAERSSAL